MDYVSHNIGWPIAAGMMAVHAASVQREADRARFDADDAATAAAIHAAAARGFASAVGELRNQLADALAEISRLRATIDDRDDAIAQMTVERSAILRAAGDLLAENEALRARH